MGWMGNPLQRREKVFARPRGVPLDRNAKARIMAAAKGYNGRHKAKGQHRGPLTRTTLEVLHTLLWKFHNSRAGDCFPSYETIAEKAECSRDSVRVAIRALEAAELLTWVNCFHKVRTQAADMFGRIGSAWRVMRTSNAYLFRDPLPCAPVCEATKTENPPGTLNQEDSPRKEEIRYVVLDPKNRIDAALIRMGRNIGALPSM